MGSSQQPNVSRALILGAGLAGLGVALFLLVYFGLSGMDTLPRLMIAMCLPPVMITILAGGYVLVAGKSGTK